MRIDLMKTTQYIMKNQKLLPIYFTIKLVQMLFYRRIILIMEILHQVIYLELIKEISS